VAGNVEKDISYMEVGCGGHTADDCLVEGADPDLHKNARGTKGKGMSHKKARAMGLAQDLLTDKSSSLKGKERGKKACEPCI